ncbi:hypothetical protein X943_003314 [Babesia divergens]|uniref:Uncharacterized protein n=1 Tax=Babesia divergens TaxID=32595 RepID=A0AAD9GFT5_BABDI|nr:hypothetical protein X943_003314 [Babesia divergens]
MERFSGTDENASRTQYIDRATFESLSPLQQSVLLMLIRCRLFNPRWGEHARNFLFHHDSVINVRKRCMFPLYITTFRKVYMLYYDVRPSIPTDVSTMTKEHIDWIVTLIMEPYRCLEHIRALLEPGYTPLPVEAMTATLQYDNTYDLYYNYRGLYTELQSFDIMR